MLDYIALGMLQHTELTGYDLKKYIEKGVGVFYRPSYGNLYPSLSRMVEKGFLLMEERSEGKRQKKYYRITDCGRNAFLGWLTSPVTPGENMDSYLVKVYFFDALSAEERRLQLTSYEKNCKHELEKLEELERYFAALPDMDRHYYKLSTLYYGMAIYRKNMEWCRHIRENKPLQEFSGVEDSK
ncbi:MAG: PadR family transcriptional regulator [Oscillospiraceae bacterium]